MENERALIDRLDEGSRLQDIQHMLFALQNESDLTNYTIEQDEPVDNNSIIHDDQDDSDERDFKEPIYDLVKKLINDLHTSNTEIHSLQYQLKHGQLLADSISTREQKLKIENENLCYELAKREQDIILLEVSKYFLIYLFVLEFLTFI